MEIVYVSRSWGVHDQRWVTALHALGHTCSALSLRHDQDATVTVRQTIDRSRPSAIVAGPLTSVTRDLSGIDVPLVGISWGFDLHELAAVGDTGWLPRLDALVVDSSATRTIALSAGLSPERITLLPWGVDLEQFTPDGPRADLAHLEIPSGSRIILSLRAHEPLYRVGDTIAALALLPQTVAPTHLLIGHSGSLTEALRDQATSLGIAARVTFVGSMSEGELPSLLRAVDCYVSAAEVDGSSVTLLQAMACGTPVAVSDSAGNLDWVRDGVTGTLFRTADPESLAAGLGRVLSDPARAARWAQAARQLIARDADWSANIGRLGKAIDIAVESR